VGVGESAGTGEECGEGSGIGNVWRVVRVSLVEQAELTLSAFVAQAQPGW